MTKTILYYTSNREDPTFEQKIINDMLSKKGSLPLISISQKPMDLGHNICVGDVGLSYVNEWKQILIGCLKATTDYVIMAESDFLYPPEYFQYEPDGKDLYHWGNVWIVWHKGFAHSHRKKRSEGAMIVRRQYLIDLLEKYLSRFPDWTDKHYKKLQLDTPGVRLHHSPYHKIKLEIIETEQPCVSFKTGRGCNFTTGTMGGRENIAKILPYWGNIDDLKSKYL